MDELQTIREAYGEPEPPTLREMTEARARVLEEPGPRRVRFGWRVKTGLGVVAAGAAVAVAVPFMGPGSPAPPSSRLEPGRQAVLAAADKAAAQPTGKYWFSDLINGRSYIVRPKTGGFAIVGAHFESFRWAGAKAGTGEAFYGRDLPSRPLTPQDAKLWRKAGSPSKFRVWSNDHYYTYDTSATAWRADDPDPAGGGTWLNGRPTEEILSLPADPKALAEMFFTPDGGWEPRKSPSNERERKIRELQLQKRKAALRPRNKVLMVGDILSRSPVPPDVRAGFMRALAAQPGITAIGETADPLGRKGVALASATSTTKITAESGAPPQERGEYGSREEIIFDRETGEVLATQRVLTVPGGPYKDREPGFVISYGIVRDTGWTDTVPKPPAKPPF